jgi:hypothetical protein
MEVHDQLGRKAKDKPSLTNMSKRLKDFEHDDGVHKKRADKQKQKEEALKKRYNMEIDSQKLKKFSNSSYLTPEAASYLNEAMRAGNTKVDDEVVYAGLHKSDKQSLKFKRSEKFSSKYTKDRQSKRKKKGRFG